MTEPQTDREFLDSVTPRCGGMKTLGDDERTWRTICSLKISDYRRLLSLARQWVEAEKVVRAAEEHCESNPMIDANIFRAVRDYQAAKGKKKEGE